MFDIGGVVRGVVNHVVHTVEQYARPQQRAANFTGTQPNDAEATVALRHLVNRVAQSSNPVANFFHDLFTVTPVERQAIEQQKDIDDGIHSVLNQDGTIYGMTAELSRQLEGKTDDYRAQLIGELQQQAGGLMGAIVQTAGGRASEVGEHRYLTPDQQLVIAQSLGAAYDGGQLPADFVNNLLTGEALRNPPDNEASGNLIGMSGSDKLITAYADKALELSRLDGGDKLEGYRVGESINSFVLGASRALAGSPTLLRERLDSMSWTELKSFVGSLDSEQYGLDHKYPPDGSFGTALASFIEGASRIQPPSEGVVNLFKLGARDYIDRPFVSEALTAVFTAGHTEYLRAPNGKVLDTVFHSNAQVILKALTDYSPQTPADISSGRVRMLTNFLRHTVFDKNAEYSSNDEAVFGQVKEYVTSLRSRIENDSSLSETERMTLARQAGHAVGGMLGAYNETIRDFGDEDASHDRRVKMAIMVASTLASFVAGPEAHWVVKGGIKVGSFALNKFLQGRPPEGEKELKAFENLLRAGFDNYDGDLHINGLSAGETTQVENEIVDGANEALTTWAENEGILDNPFTN